jgi:hypothetical protein
VNRFVRVSSGADEKERALARLRITIGNRVRRICMGMSELDFDAMVDSMARVHFKYEMLGA